MDLDLTPLLFLLALVSASILAVYVATTAYFRWKQNRFWSNAFDLDAPPETDEERAALELYNLPEGTQVEFTDPEGDPAAEALQADIAKDVAEMKAVKKAKARYESQQRLDYDRIPTGEVFTDLDGRQYKFIEVPNGHAGPDYVRSKISVGGAVTNPNAIPFPSDRDLSLIMKRQSVEAVESVDGNVLNVELDNDVCEICAVAVEHNHSGGEVRRFVYDRAESAFKKYVEQMDLTKLSAEDVQKLWARCKARIENDASLSAMLALDGLFVRAQKLAQEDAEDEAFYREACREAERGPVSTCNIEPPPGYDRCTRAIGHTGPCAMPKYLRTCGNCEDLSHESRAVENCGCGFDTTEPVYKTTAQPQPLEMPKRFMEGITHQIAQAEVCDGLRAFGAELAEEIVEEDEKHRAYAAIGQLMEKLQEEPKDHFVEAYGKLSTEELLKRTEAMLDVARGRARADKMKHSRRPVSPFKKPGKKKPRKK